MVKIYVESKRGHDTIDIPKEEVQTTIEKELQNNKLATIEKTDGQKELLTGTDIPNGSNPLKSEEELREEQEYWAKKFEETKSAIITSKSKAG